MKRCLILLLLSITFQRLANGQSCTTAVCNAPANFTPAQLLAAMPNGSAPATVTVNLPAGSSTFTSQFIYSIPSNVTNLTIKGATTVNCTGTPGQPNYVCAATDNTVITDNYNVADQPILRINVGSAAFRMTGITFQGNPALTVGKNNGFVTFGGSSTSFRVDHCHVNITSYHRANGGMTIFNALNGVFDHNLFEGYGPSNAVRLYPETWGDVAFSQPSQWGTSNFLFLESNEFFHGGINDCNNGGRMVIRYNTAIGDPNVPAESAYWQGHQVGQGVERLRGCRALEVYNGYYFVDNSLVGNGFTVGGGAGTGILFGNSITGWNFDTQWYVDRELAANACGGGGPPRCQPPPGGFGYCGTGSTGVASVWDGNASTATGYPCLEQTGRGQGDLLNNLDFPNTRNTTTSCVPTSPPGCSVWPHELREPWYIWNETMHKENGSGAQAIYTAPTFNGVRMFPDRDFYTQPNTTQSANTSPTLPFNGTSGTGYGPLSFRPTTCTAGPGGTFDTSPIGSYGVGYFATDANGGVGELYVCTATNVWTPTYQPYTYPHPLTNPGPCIVSSVSVSPSTANVNINATQQFTANVNFTGTCAGTVTWSVTGGGSINSTGLYTAPNTATSGVVVRATSTDNGSISGTASVTVVNPAAPAVSLSPSTVSFGNQNINTTSAAQTVTLTNTGGANLVVSGVTVSSAFTNAGTGTCAGTSFTLAPSASCTFKITFTPSATIAYSGTLSVTDNASGSPHTVALSGQGVQPVITWTPTSYSFGTQTTGTSTNSSNLQLSNTGTGPLAVALSIGGTNPTQFSIFSTTCPNPLNAGAACNVITTFSPLSAANFSATLIETDANAFVSAPYGQFPYGQMGYGGGLGSNTLALSGTGVSPVSPPPVAPAVNILLE